MRKLILVQIMLLLLLNCIASTEGANCPPRVAYIPETTTGFNTDGSLFGEFQAECCPSGRTTNWTVTTANLSPDTTPFQGALSRSIARVTAICSSGDEISTPLYGYNGTQTCPNNDTTSSQLSQPDDDGAFYYEVYKDFHLVNFMGVGGHCKDLDCMRTNGIISCPAGTSPIGVGARSSCFSIVALQVVCAKTDETQNNLGESLDRDAQCPQADNNPRSDQLIARTQGSLSNDTVFEEISVSSSGAAAKMTECCPIGEAIAKWRVGIASTEFTLYTAVANTSCVAYLQGQCTDGTILAPMKRGFNGSKQPVCHQQEPTALVSHYLTPKSLRLYCSTLRANSTNNVSSINILGSFIEPPVPDFASDLASRTGSFGGCPSHQAPIGYYGSSSCNYLSNVSILCGALSRSANRTIAEYGSIQDNPPTDGQGVSMHAHNFTLRSAGVCQGGQTVVPDTDDTISTGILASSLVSSCCPSGHYITAFNVWPSDNTPARVGQVSAVCSDLDGNDLHNTSAIAYGFNGTFLNGTASFCPNTTGEMRSTPLVNETWNYRLNTHFESLMEWPVASTSTNDSTSTVKSSQCPSGQQPLGFLARRSCWELTDFRVICGSYGPHPSPSTVTGSASAENGQNSGSSRTVGIAVGASLAGALLAILAAFIIYRHQIRHKRKACMDSRQLFNLNAPAGFANGYDLQRQQAGLNKQESPRLMANGLISIAGIGCSDDDSPVSFGGIPPEWEIKPNQLKIYCVDGKPIELGRGGFGVVLYGTVHKEEAAIKMLTRKSQEAELLKEIAILERAKTKYVVRFLGYSVCPDGLLLAMEFMPGGNLWQKLRKSDEFQWYQRGQQAFKDICKGMYMLHSNRIAHLDMKSPNILIAGDGRCKISDLGLGRLLGPDAKDTTGEGLGSFAWMAPEQMNGRCGLSSDIWALSTIIWEICTTKSPVGVPRENLLGEVQVPEEAPQAVLDLMKICRLENPVDRPLIGDICDLMDSWGS